MGSVKFKIKFTSVFKVSKFAQVVQSNSSKTSIQEINLKFSPLCDYKYYLFKEGIIQ